MRAKGTDGKDYVADVLDPPGFSRTGLDAKAVTDKFHRVTTDHLPQAARDRIVESVMALDRRPNVSDLMAALATANAACSATAR
jgi:hypothetical protein